MCIASCVAFVSCVRGLMMQVKSRPEVHAAGHRPYTTLLPQQYHYTYAVCTITHGHVRLLVPMSTVCRQNFSYQVALN